jgi:hypothetical protein
MRTARAKIQIES